LLTIIYSVCSGERENHEPQKSAQEISQKIQDLQKKIDQARSDVRVFTYLILQHVSHYKIFCWI